MPSFDVVSEVNTQEVANAVDQANREISGRFDFRGSDARVEWADGNLTLHADDEFKVEQVRDILHNKLTKRMVDVASLEPGTMEKAAGGKARQGIRVREGIDTDTARKMVKLIKDSKLKVQVAIQGDKVRVTGKQRDDLQAVMAFLRKQDLGLPLQYTNFRD
jgi:uncharacterized protein YajQ (UPF0234 family)